MAESFYQKRRREMGLDKEDTTAKKSGIESSSSPSFYDNRRMELGLIPDTRPKEPPIVDPSATTSYNKVDRNSLEVRPIASSSYNKVDVPEARAMEPIPESDVPKFTENPIGYLVKGNPVGRFLERTSSSIASSLAPDDPYIDKSGKLLIDQPTPKDRAIERQQATGNGGFADTAADFIGEAGSFFVPVGGSTAGQLYNNPLTQRLAGQVGSRFGSGLGGRVAQEATREAIVGVPLALQQGAAQGEVSPREVGFNALEGGALGAIGGAAAPVVGTGLRAAGRGIAQGYNKLTNEMLPTSSFSAFGQRVGQKLRRPEKPEQIKDLIDVGGRPEKDRSTWEKFKTAVIDELEPLRRATQQIGGKNVPTEQNPFKMAWLSRGWKGKADTKLEYGIVDDAGNKVGASLKEVLAPVSNRLDDLRELSVALRSIEYADAGLESGVSSELAQQTIQRYAKDTDLQQAYQGMRKYITDMNQSTLVDSGLWSEDKLLKYQTEQPNYIPMFRTREKGIRDFPQSASNKRFGNQKAPEKRRTGSKSVIVDPLESIIKQTYKNQSIAEKNKVMRSLVELAEANPDNGLVVPVTKNNAAESIQTSLDEFIMNPSQDMENQLQEALKLFEPQTIDGKRNVFTVMRNGKAEQWQVNDDQLAKVIAGLNTDSSGTLMNIIGRTTGILKAGLVLAPDFVVKNLVRDQMGAFINSKYGFIPIWDTLSGLTSAIRKDNYFYKWMSNGGANGAWVSLERDYLQGQIHKMVRKGVVDTVKNKANIIDKLRKLSEISEQATRLGEFKRGLKKGATLKDAALASRDVTLDFSRIGSKTKDFNKAIAFFNVAVQSVDKMARQFKEHPVKTTSKAALSITVPSALLYALNYKDERYQELPQWEKDTYWHVFIGDEIVKIPKPFEAGVIFGTFTERMLQSMAADDPKAFDGYAMQVVDGFTPSIIPTLLVPWIEAFSNKDTFTKSPIVPKREENLNKPDQYGAYTSEIAKAAGQLTGQSPRVIENTVTGYTGTLGRYGMQIADSALKMSGRVDTPPKPEGGLATIPGIRSFFSKGLEGSSKSMDEFYKEREKLTNNRNSAKKNKESFKDEGKYRKYNKIADQIGDQQAEIRRVLDARDIDPAEKRRRIQEANLRMINLARMAKGEEPIK